MMGELANMWVIMSVRQSEERGRSRRETESVGKTNDLRLRHALVFGVGWVFVVLGFVGIFVPVLPTTPFLLLAAWCFLRSNERAYAWLCDHRILGPYVKSYLAGRGMPVRAKAVSILLVWLTCGTSAAFALDNIYGRMAVLACALIATTMILRVRSSRPEDSLPM
jgi:uncharacterized membrane protein YbaN (DUF454 family)